MHKQALFPQRDLHKPAVKAKLGLGNKANTGTGCHHIAQGLATLYFQGRGHFYAILACCFQQLLAGFRSLFAKDQGQFGHLL